MVEEGFEDTKGQKGGLPDYLVANWVRARRVNVGARRTVGRFARAVQAVLAPRSEVLRICPSSPSPNAASGARGPDGRRGAQ